MRLTDEELARLERDAVAGLYGAAFAEIVDAVAELRERRSADLTAEDVEALAKLAVILSRVTWIEGAEWSDVKAAQVALTRLTRAGRKA